MPRDSRRRAQAFAFFLGHDGGAGELVLGGVDPSHYEGDISYVPVRDIIPGKAGYWEIALDDISIEGASVTSVKKAVRRRGSSAGSCPRSRTSTRRRRTWGAARRGAGRAVRAARARACSGAAPRKTVA